MCSKTVCYGAYRYDETMVSTERIGARQLFATELTGTSKALARCVGPSKVREN